LLPDNGSLRDSARMARPPASISTCSEPVPCSSFVGALDAELPMWSVPAVGRFAQSMRFSRVVIRWPIARGDLPAGRSEEARLDLEAGEAEAFTAKTSSPVSQCGPAGSVLALLLQLAPAVARATSTATKSSRAPRCDLKA
jgi:hypothetical protein